MYRQPPLLLACCERSCLSVKSSYVYECFKYRMLIRYIIAAVSIMMSSYHVTTAQDAPMLMCPLDTVVFVDIDAIGANDGASWADAFTDLQDALALACNCEEVREIWVAEGVYIPSVEVDFDASGGTDPREATFQLCDSLRLYGGFEGTEAAVSERSAYQDHPTILSGDIDNNDLNADGNNLAEDTSQVVGDNAYHVVSAFDLAKETIVEGFYVTAGKADTGDFFVYQNSSGGGFFNFSGIDTLGWPCWRLSTFIGNFALDDGGAIYNGIENEAGLNSTLDSCQFIRNTSGFQGGAITNSSRFQPGQVEMQVINCLFKNNEALRSGGGIYNNQGDMLVSECLFDSNRTTIIVDDGSTSPGAGGAIFNLNASPLVDKTIFTSNSSTGNPTGFFEGGGGGAVHNANGMPTYLDCFFSENSTGGNSSSNGGAAVNRSDGDTLIIKYINCVFANNNGDAFGGAIMNWTRTIDPMMVGIVESRFTNCTFFGNTAGRGGAIYNSAFTNPDDSQGLTTILENCVLGTNTSTVEGGQLFTSPTIDAEAVNTIQFSLIEGSGGSGAGWDTSLGTDAGNNIDDNPNFSNTADIDGADNIPATTDDGLTLQSPSPAINVGNNVATDLMGITEDIAGSMRIFNGTIDLGAYESMTDEDVPDTVVICHLTNWKAADPDKLNHAIYLYSSPLDPDLVNGEDTEFQRFLWETSGTLTIINDTLAMVRGIVQSPVDANAKFDVFIELRMPATWLEWQAMGGAYHIPPDPVQAAFAMANFMDWRYWHFGENSRLEGLGDLSGTLFLSQAPDPLTTPDGFKLRTQEGIGANDKDSDNGISGWFFYEGNIAYMGEHFLLNSKGDINADISRCDTTIETLEVASFVVSPTAQMSGESEVLISFETVVDGHYPIMVERSIDGQIFETIGEVEGSGKLITSQTHQLNDIFAYQADQLYYRLKTLHPDHNYTYSRLISVNSDSLFKIESEYRVYPIPVEDVLHVRGIHPAYGSHMIRILTSKGRVVYQQRITDMLEESTIPLSALTTGLYFLQIIKPDGSIEGERFVKKGSY